MRNDKSLPFAVFRADASSQIGGGHVMRCLSLADALAKQGWVCAFASSRNTRDTVPSLGRSSHEQLVLDDTVMLEHESMKTHWKNGCDLLVVDHYQRDSSFEAICHGWAKKVIAIDDLANRRHHCDVLIDQTLARTPMAYAGLVPRDAICLTGSEFSMLRPAFAAAREESLIRRAKTKSINEILISVGTVDQANVLPVILNGLERSGFRALAHIIGNIMVPADTFSFETIVTAQSDNMADLMMSADLAIGACGTMSWERCCLGLPTVALVTAENQRDIANALSSADAILLVDQTSESEIAEAIVCLTSDHSTWRRVSKAAAGICDGNGVQRVIRLLNKLH